MAVVGLGGIFFKSRDPKALGTWYRDVLGIDVADWGGAIFGSRDSQAPRKSFQVWSPFAAETDYFEPSSRDYMINFEVDDLDATLQRAQAKGVVILRREDNDPNGRFAWLLDPDGTKIELWEPKPA